MIRFYVIIIYTQILNNCNYLLNCSADMTTFQDYPQPVIYYIYLPYNPPHIMPLIEIASGERTAIEAVIAAKRFYETVGKVPIILNREVPGYLGNRMSAALWREAVNLALSGVASVEDIDKAIRYGPGLRWSVVGPHMTYHLGGGKGGIRYHTEHLLTAKEKIWADLDDWKTFPLEALDILMAGLPDPNTTSSLSVERDEALIRVIKALYLQ